MHYVDAKLVSAIFISMLMLVWDENWIMQLFAQEACNEIKSMPYSGQGWKI